MDASYYQVTKAMLFFFALCFIVQPGNTQTVQTLTAPFNGSGGVKIGPDGYVYIADFGASLNNSNGRQVSKFSHSMGLEIFANSGLLGASGNDFDDNGDLIQSNIALNRISKIKPDGSVSAFSAIGIVNPVGVLVHNNGSIYICNCGDNSIRRLNQSGIGADFARGAPLFCPNGITQDNDGNIYISNFSNGKVIRLEESGRMSTLVTLPGGNNGHLTFANGVLYVCSHGSSKIYEVKLDGSFRVLAGSGIRGNQDGSFSEAQFSRPNGIVATKTGDTLYLNSSIPVTDAGGRPLNPSVLRMITGVRNFTLAQEQIKEETFEVNLIRRTNSKFWVNIESPFSRKVNIRIIGETGKIISEIKDYFIDEGDHQYELDVSSLSNRLIILEVSSDQWRRTFKLL